MKDQNIYNNIKKNLMFKADEKTQNYFISLKYNKMLNGSQEN